MPGSFKAEAALAKHYATGFRTVLFGMALERMVCIYCYLPIKQLVETSRGIWNWYTFDDQ